MNQTDNEFPKSYDYNKVEKIIYSYWQEKNLFSPDMDDNKDPFTVIMPPPNVTGTLHYGHALTTAIEDALIRWNRMKGKSTLWLPGSDHAGIATQVVVEKMLMDTQGVSRHEIGREKFLEHVWEWVDKYGGIIDEQFNSLGASCDWSRKSFTLDEGPSLAVRTTFVNLYNKGRIYRGEKIINWCPRCLTSLSDLEVKHSEEKGDLYYIRYKVVGRDETLTVATTRPETLFGDTAVAVNPFDERYSHLLESKIIIPLINKEVNIISDEAVELGFGTGALKVTPAHDINDFEIGLRHKLDTINVMNPDGTLNQFSGKYEGKDRMVVRKESVAELESLNLLDKIESIVHSIGRCDRCDTIVEPLISKQWFLEMKPLAEPAIKAVNNGDIRIIPERFTKIYLNWMNNIRDWCISRQLWWGHRIPVWYCNLCDNMTVSISAPEACSSCKSTDIYQDSDVLDTWFSSGLWTHSTLGWPNNTKDLNKFYPTSVMETGYDILFFWVARMIVFGIENMGVSPFHTIYLHGLLRDETGAKMSKSKGNVLDPLDAIQKYGADALRFALTTGSTPGNDVRISENKLESGRNFCNKIWNSCRFINFLYSKTDGSINFEIDEQNLKIEDIWILSRLSILIQDVNKLLEDYQLGEAERILHDYIWSDFCDWYIEMAKVRFAEGDKEIVSILIYIMDILLRLLHPFMPFITEELWHRIHSIKSKTNKITSIMISDYPQSSIEVIGDDSKINIIIELIRGIRNVRSEFNIQGNEDLNIYIDTTNSDSLEIINIEKSFIKNTTKINDILFTQISGTDPSKSIKFVVSDIIVTIPLSGLVNMEKEIERLNKELSEVDNNINRLQNLLKSENFVNKAPEEVVEAEQDRLNLSQERQYQLQEILKSIT
ncbi:MAG: valine--tRNA ligase [Chloroflexi bacterium]|nr:valine--tRNA ligase [Chloroflexota bacterium]|tara:strand:+ start:11313 stop:13973 length:2661 start_codon:yes stop_codon:yes gene_type:complete